MAVFLRKLMRIGGLPDDLRTQVDAEGIIYLAEYVPVTRRFSGSVPGKRSNANIASYVGSLAISSQRVLATLSSVPKLAGRTIDQRWDAEQTGPVKADISDSGLHIEVDIGEVDPKFDGRLSLNYKTDIGEDVLMRLPRRSLAFEVPREYVLRDGRRPCPGLTVEPRVVSSSSSSHSAKDGCRTRGACCTTTSSFTPRGMCPTAAITLAHKGSRRGCQVRAFEMLGAEAFSVREVNTSGDGFLAMFDGPQRAIRCAMVIGSGLEFDDRGIHELKGVPGQWNLYAVA